MATINSVLGPLNTSSLGFVLAHEHIASSTAGVIVNYPELLGDNYMDRIVAELKEAKAGGIDTIVDCAVLDIGRDVNLLAEASRRSGINIICTTGFYVEPLRHFMDISSDQFAKLFIREIRQGIAGTGIKPGLLKSASDIGGVTKFSELILRAIARAHKETGTPIFLHSYAPGQVGKDQLGILKQEGVDMTRVKVDHVADTVDMEYLTWILDQGCYLGLERLPGRNGPSWLARIKTIKALIDAGYIDRICPSHDWMVVTIRDVAERSTMKREVRSKNNPYGLLWLKKVGFPKLKELGVSDAMLAKLCVDAPRKFFEGK